MKDKWHYIGISSERCNNTFAADREAKRFSNVAMTEAVTIPHQQRFEQIKKNLTLLGNRESNFLQVELLFFEALTLSRNYGEDMQENALLRALKDLQQEQYAKTKSLTNKPSQREQFIRKFVVRLKQILSGKL